MEVSTEKSMNGQKLEEVTSFKYMGVTLCKAEVRIRIALAMAAIARLNMVWLCNTISFASKFRLYKSLVTPSSSTAVKHGPCLRMQAFETKRMRKLLRISSLKHKTND